MHRPGLSNVIGFSCIENIYPRYGSDEASLSLSAVLRKYLQPILSHDRKQYRGRIYLRKSRKFLFDNDDK